MDIERIYNTLNSDETDDEGKRRLLTEYLQEQVKNLPPNNEDRRQTAYEIAGLRSTKFAMSLNEDDPIEQALSLAGELEVPDTDDEKWESLKRLAGLL